MPDSSDACAPGPLRIGGAAGTDEAGEPHVPPHRRAARLTEALTGPPRGRRRLPACWPMFAQPRRAVRPSRTADVLAVLAGPPVARAAGGHPRRVGPRLRPPLRPRRRPGDKRGRVHARRGLASPAALEVLCMVPGNHVSRDASATLTGCGQLERATNDHNL